MRIGLDARKLRDGGIGTYIRGLLAAFAARPSGHAFVAFLDSGDAGRAARAGGPIDEVIVRAGKYSLAEHLVLPRAARRAGVELFHAPHYTLPLLWNGPSVVTIHDLIHLRFPRFHPPGASLYARAMAGSAARRARLVLTDSAHTRDDVVELFGIPAERTRVIPLGVSEGIAPRAAEAVAVFRRVRSLPADYLLYVGARKRHKNLPLLFEALGAMPAADRPPLVLSGARWRGDDPLAEVARRHGVEDALHFAGDVSGSEELSLLYSGARLYVHPSLAEGFGLPPLEAMACGVPVLASNAGSLPEVLGDAARLLPPHGAGAWAHAIADLVGDGGRRGEMVRCGLERARAFTFARTAALTLEAYEEAVRSAA